MWLCANVVRNWVHPYRFWCMGQMFSVCFSFTTRLFRLSFHKVKFIFLSNWNYAEGLQYWRCWMLTPSPDNDHSEKEKKFGGEYEEIWWRRRRNEWVSYRALLPWVMLNSAPWLHNEHSEKEKKGGKGEFDILHNIKTTLRGLQYWWCWILPPGQTMTIVVTCGPSAKLASRAMD